MKAFTLSTQQHPDGGLVVTLVAHVNESELDVVAKLYALGDELTPMVRPAPERTSGAVVPEFYNQDAPDASPRQARPRARREAAG